MTHSFQPIWISTIAHLDEHVRITGSTSFFSKWVGSRFNCPKEYPHIQLLGGLLFYTKIPLVFCAHGAASVEDGTIKFTSTPPKIWGSRVSGQFVQQDFQLKRVEIQSLSTYRHPNPYWNWANLEWIRVETNEDVYGGDFLMCVAGIWPKTIQLQTDKLFSALQGE